MLYVTVSMALQEALNRERKIDDDSADQIAWGLDAYVGSHVSLAMCLADIKVGDSLKAVRNQAEQNMSYIEGEASDNRYGPTIDGIMDGHEDFLRLSFSRDLQGTEIFGDGCTLREYIGSGAGEYLPNSSLLSNSLSNIIDSCRSPHLGKGSFRQASAGVWIMSRFGKYSEYKSGNGRRSYSIYIDSNSLAEEVCHGASSGGKDVVVIVGGMPDMLQEQFDRGEGDDFKRSFTGGKTAFHFNIDDANAPFCADVVRRLYPESAVILGKGIRSSVFYGLHHVAASDDTDLDKIFWFGPSYADVDRIVELVRMHERFCGDSLDEVLLPKVKRILGL